MGKRNSDTIRVIGIEAVEFTNSAIVNKTQEGSSHPYCCEVHLAWRPTFEELSHIVHFIAEDEERKRKTPSRNYKGREMVKELLVESCGENLDWEKLEKKYQLEGRFSAIERRTKLIRTNNWDINSTLEIVKETNLPLSTVLEVLNKYWEKTRG